MSIICFLGFKAQKIKIACGNQYFLLIDLEHALKLSNIYIRYQIGVVLERILLYLTSFISVFHKM